MLEYIHYLIYPIAGVLALLALGGINTKQPIVVSSSIISIALNVYAIVGFVWWPIAISLIIDFVFKKFFGDPGEPMG